MRHSCRLIAALLAGLLALAACDGGSSPKAGTATSTVPPPTAPAPTTAPPSPPPDNVYAATTAGNMAPAVAGIPTRVYVPNSDSRSVDVIDPATFKVIDHFAVGKVPEHITPSWNL